jgi:hypothetical protein
MSDKIEVTIKNKAGKELLECEMNVCPRVGEKLEIDYKTGHQKYDGTCKVVDVIHCVNAFHDINKEYPTYYEGNFVMLIVEELEE